MRSLVPAYIWAGDHERWRALIRTRPDAVIVNPASGPPGPDDRVFRRRADELEAAGIVRYGYVPLGWLRDVADRRVEAALQAIGRWRDMVPTIEGIFLDESPSGWRSGDEHALGALLDATTGLLPDGAPEHAPLVLNPGTTVEPGWQERWNEVLWCTFEGSAADFLAADPTPTPGGRQVALVHSCRSSAERRRVLERAGDAGWSWAHATTGRLPDPWRTVPRASLGRLSP